MHDRHRAPSIDVMWRDRATGCSVDVLDPASGLNICSIARTMRIVINSSPTRMTSISRKHSPTGSASKLSQGLTAPSMERHPTRHSERLYKPTSDRRVRSSSSQEGLIAAQECIPNNDLRDAFSADFSVLARNREALSPDPVLLQYETDYRWLAQVV